MTTSSYMIALDATPWRKAAAASGTWTLRKGKDYWLGSRERIERVARRADQQVSVMVAKKRPLFHTVR